MSSRIQLLTAQVANKIAAGEVVERPASVLKELLENALDAGATQINVDIVAGGRKLIAVSDNGSGMGRDDALMSVERHATSKIKDVDDIEHIATLGFRGEALAAISSVSRFTLQTSEKDADSGTRIEISAGRINDVTDASCAPGTLIEVRNLFFNVPARRKFLRTHQTELSHVRDMFIVHALAHPDVGMSLNVDGRQTYTLAGGGTLQDRIRELFGRDYIKNLVAVEARFADARLSGLASLPGASRGDRNEQYIFVNGRPAAAPIIHRAIREGYQTLLMPDRHPSVFLFLDMDPELVDVNVHPTKKEVRFRRPSDVRDLIIEGLRTAFDREPPASGSTHEMATHPPAMVAEHTQMKILDLPPTRSFRYPSIPLAETAKPEHWTIDKDMSLDSTAIPAPASGTHASGDDTEGALSSPWSYCRVLGQIGDLYVVLETDDGYVMMDPHAAHERVLFDRFMSDFLKGKVESQSLLIPETVDLMPADAERVRKHLDLFQQMGFGVSDFGGDSFVIDAMPSYFSGASSRSMLIDISEGFEKGGRHAGRERWREHAIATAACRAAVKARDRLTMEEIEGLVNDLARTRMPYTCPHGRPTLIFTSYRELNRKFGRE